MSGDRRRALVVGTSLVAAISMSGCQGREPTSSPLGPTRSPAVASESPSSEPAKTSPVSCPRRGGWTIEDPRIEESSGLTRSRVHPGVLYTHNDRGSPSNLFAVDASGTRAVLRLVATSVDWEDVASTPDGRIWIADTGDNDRVRRTVQIHVIEEPELLVSARVPVTTFDLQYPDGPKNAEALLVDPRDNRVYVVTKEQGAGQFYQAPAELEVDRPNLLRAVGPAPNNITGGDFSPRGDRLVLRNQARAFFYDEAAGAPTELELPPQPQGESITFTDDGRYVLIGSEGADSVVLCVKTPSRAGR